MACSDPYANISDLYFICPPGYAPIPFFLPPEARLTGNGGQAGILWRPPGRQRENALVCRPGRADHSSMGTDWVPPLRWLPESNQRHHVTVPACRQTGVSLWTLPRGHGLHKGGHAQNLKCPVRVVWVFRKTQWIALFSTDLDLTTAQIIEYYGASLPAVRQGGKLNPVSKKSNRTSGAAKARSVMPMRS